MESARDPGLEQVLISGAVNPKVIGRRVVVRSIVPGETGPTGGPAFTDTLGILESERGESVRITRRDGSVAEIPIGLIVSGKVIPPPPQRRRN